MPSNCGVGKWTVKRSNKSILREINPEYSLEGLMLEFLILVLWGKQLTHWKSPWCWERLREEGEEGIRGWDGRMESLMQWTWTWANFRRWWGTERPGVLQSMGSQRAGQDCTTEQPQQQAIPIGKDKILNKRNLEGKRLCGGGKVPGVFEGQ